MRVPDCVRDRIAAVEREIDLIDEEARRQLVPLRVELQALEFAISAFAADEAVAPIATNGQPVTSKAAVLNLLQANGTMTAKAIGQELGVSDYHSVGAILGALSQLNRIKRAGNGWKISA